MSILTTNFEEPTKWGTATEVTADRYSRTNTMQRGYGHALTEMMNISKGQHVLVAACGPGSDVLDIAQIVGPTGKVVGFDLDKYSIKRAREALEEHPKLKPYVELHVADVHDLSMFAGQKFDAIHCNMSYHWFSDKPLFLAQAATLAKPGTAIGLATQDGAFHLPIQDVRDDVLAELGEPIDNFIWPSTLAEMQRDLSAAGFGDVKVSRGFGTRTLENVEALWNWCNDSTGNRFGYHLQGEKAERMKDMVMERFRGLALDDGRAILQFKHLSTVSYYGR